LPLAAGKQVGRGTRSPAVIDLLEVAPFDLW